MKVKPSVKPICEHCQIRRKDGRIICKNRATNRTGCKEVTSTWPELWVDLPREKVEIAHIYLWNWTSHISFDSGCYVLILIRE